MKRFLKTELLISCVCLVAICVGCAPSAPAKQTHFANVIGGVVANEKVNEKNFNLMMEAQRGMFEDDPASFDDFLKQLEDALLADEKAKSRAYPLLQKWKEKRGGGGSSGGGTTDTASGGGGGATDPASGISGSGAASGLGIVAP